MRILQAHNRHGVRGGADRVMDTEAAILRAAGHHVEQFTVPAGDESGMSPAAMAAAAVVNREVVRELGQRLRQLRPDVLHVHTPFPLMSPAVFWTAKRHGVATVATLHSFRYSCIAGTLRRDGHLCEDCVGSRLKLAGVRHRCYHGSLGASAALTTSLVAHGRAGTFRRHVDRFLPLTEFAAEILRRDGIPPGRITVKPNCVPDPGTSVPLQERDDTILFVGRLVEEKGIRTLVEAWSAAATGATSLLIAGDGPLRPELEAVARTDPTIELLGWLGEEEVCRLQRRARVTVVPSEWYEAGPPLVLLQALAAATPVVASDLENISRTVRESGAGLTFRAGDAADLAVTLERLSTPDVAAATGRQARRLYERDHTEAAVLDTLESVYAQLTDPPTRESG